VNKKHRSLVVLTALIAGMTVGCKNYASVPYATGAPSGGPNGSGGSSGSALPNLTPIGNMTTPRAGHTATLLPDGRVLVAGGDATGRTAELYDPSTRTFTPTGSMTTSRGPHAAILLTNGKVLIVGGAQDLSAELYDSATGTFTATGKMIAEGGIPATQLQDGRVLVAGVNAEIYDPATGSFALTVAYPDPNAVWGTATLLADGRVLLTGCAMACSVGATELYNPKANTFSPTGPMVGWNDVNTATLLVNGRVLIVGNAQSDGSPDDAEVYDPVAGTFSSIGKTNAPHKFAPAVALGGAVLVFGAQLPDGSGGQAVDGYNIAPNDFASDLNMKVGRYSHTATTLPDNTVLIVGGYTGTLSPTSSAEIFISDGAGSWDY
jgi:Galactose oxidase, central domain